MRHTFLKFNGLLVPLRRLSTRFLPGHPNDLTVKRSYVQQHPHKYSQLSHYILYSENVIVPFFMGDYIFTVQKVVNNAQEVTVHIINRGREITVTFLRSSLKFLSSNIFSRYLMYFPS